MIRRILVPLDGSELAEAVLPEVKDLAKALHARVDLVQVLEVSVEELAALGVGTSPSVEAMQEMEDADRRDADSYMAIVGRWLEAEGVEVSCQAVEGSPAAKIVELAHSDEADLVAMATHGRTGLDRTIFGSVAEEVVREVGIPVLLVKPGKETKPRQR